MADVESKPEVQIQMYLISGPCAVSKDYSPDHNACPVRTLFTTWEVILICGCDCHP